MSSQESKDNTSTTNDELNLASNSIKSEPATLTAQAIEDAPKEEPEWLSGVKLFSVISGMTLASFLVLLDSSILATAVPKITSQFHSLADVGWYGAVYNLTNAVTQPLAGKLYQNFSTTWTFLVFFFIFEFGSLLCGFSTSSNMLIVGRAIAGIGCGGLWVGAMVIIALSAPMHKRAMLTGILTGCAQMGLVLGPLIGGALTQYATSGSGSFAQGWRMCFFINLPLGVPVALILFLFPVPERVKKPRAIEVLRDLPKKLDLIGFAILSAATVQLFLALEYGGNKYSWKSATVIGLFCGSAATFLLLGGWFWHKKEHSLIPYSLLMKPTIFCSSFVFAFFMSRQLSTSYYLPLYFQGVKGVSATLSGVFLLPLVIVQVIAAIVGAKLLSLIGYYVPFAIFGGVLTTIASGLLSTLTATTPNANWIGYLILMGVGSGAGIQMPLLAAQATVEPAQIPLSMSLVQFIAALMTALWLSFGGTIFTNSLHALIPQYAPNVDAQLVIDTGAYDFRTLLRGADLTGVLLAYAKSVDRVFYLITAAAAMSTVLAWGMGWPDIRKRAPAKPTEEKV